MTAEDLATIKARLAAVSDDSKRSMPQVEFVKRSLDLMSHAPADIADLLGFTDALLKENEILREANKVALAEVERLSGIISRLHYLYKNG